MGTNFLHDRFVAGSEAVLLATDVAARGLDIPAVEHVIHYQVPKDTEVCHVDILCLSHVVLTPPPIAIRTQEWPDCKS